MALLFRKDQTVYGKLLNSKSQVYTTLYIKPNVKGLSRESCIFGSQPKTGNVAFVVILKVSVINVVCVRCGVEVISLTPVTSVRRLGLY